MPKTRQKKEQELASLQEKFDRSKSVVFTSQTGISVRDIEALRGDLKKSGGELQSIKKTLFSLFLKAKNVALDVQSDRGGLGVAFSFDDAVTAPKLVHDFSKGHEGMQIIGGVLENAVIAPEKVRVLASLPSREQLLAKTLATMQAPITGFVNVLAGTSRNFVRVLNAIKESKQ